MMAFFETEIGVPYPWGKYDQVTIMDFIAGGMENTTLTTLSDRTIFTAATENLHTSRELVAHELAHQWFGDYVTCKDWSHLWLNEGFATYYAHLYEGHKSGSDALLYGLYQDAKGQVLTQGADQRAVVYRGYKSADEQFDYRAYPKGSWILHMLRSQLGPDLYRSAVRNYLQQHALQSVVTDDLRQAFEAASGRPLDRFFDQWVYHAGHPQLTVQYEWQGDLRLAKVHVSQTQAVNEHVLRFVFPTRIRFIVGQQTIDHAIEIKDAEQDFHVPLPAPPDIVRFDPDYTVLADVKFEKPDPMWFAQLRRTDDVIGRLQAAEALANRRTHESVERLRETLNQDAFYGVRIAAADSLQRIHNDEAFQALLSSADQTDARVRQKVVRSVMEFYRPEALEFARNRLKAESNPGIQAALIRGLGRHPGDTTRQLVIQYLNSTSFENELAEAAVEAIGDWRDPRLRRPLMQALERRSNQFTSRGLATALTTLGQISQSLDDRSPVRDFLLDHVNDHRVRVRIGAIQGLGALRDVTAATVLETIRPTAEERVASAAREALTQLHETAAPVPGELIQTRKSLSELQQQLAELKKQLETLEGQFQSSQRREATPAQSP
jgi:aminopeptidase N